MRKLLVGLIVVGLLSVAAPAIAQPVANHFPDPLGLITSGAVLPYFGSGSLSFLEVYSPIGGTPDLHAFFFNESCVKGPDSLPMSLTENDVAIIRVDNVGLNPSTGLLTLGNSGNGGAQLNPIQNSQAIHARMLWFNAGTNSLRILDPIALATWDESVFFDPFFASWSPLRTAATFFAPFETPGTLETTIYFVCPNDNITSSKSAAAFPTSRFLPLIPAAQAAGTATPLRFFVYDIDEEPIRDFAGACNCLTTTPLATLNSAYNDAVRAPDGTYTEVFGNVSAASDAVCDFTQAVLASASNGCPFVPDSGGTLQYRQITPAVPAGGPFSFTAYRGIDSIGAFGVDVFGRVNNASRGAIQDVTFSPNNR
jgi:hypothetical protein